MFNFQIVRTKNLKHFEHGKATMESHFGFLLCPKSIINGQIITDLAKTVHFVKYYIKKLHLVLL
jgi:hypothetical protein